MPDFVKEGGTRINQFYFLSSNPTSSNIFLFSIAPFIVIPFYPVRASLIYLHWIFSSFFVFEYFFFIVSFCLSIFFLKM